jgi:hypothetical protein
MSEGDGICGKLDPRYWQDTSEGDDVAAHETVELARWGKKSASARPFELKIQERKSAIVYLASVLYPAGCLFNEKVCAVRRSDIMAIRL